MYIQKALATIQKDENPVNQLTLINNFLFENIKFVSDTQLFNCKQKTVTAEETLHLGSGDCEDFAWVAHELAVRFGFKTEDLSLLYCQVNEAEYHCVLSFNSGELILDNQLKNPRPLNRRPDLSNFKELDKACFPKELNEEVPKLRFI